MYFKLRETIINQDTWVQLDIGALNYSLDACCRIFCRSCTKKLTTNDLFLLFIPIKLGNVKITFVKLLTSKTKGL